MSNPRMDEVNSLSSVTTLLEGHLVKYLKIYGVEFDSSGKALCILNGRHDKKSKSLTIVPNTGSRKLHCFGCNFRGNIFDFANMLHGYPLRGEGFIDITIPSVANELGIEIDISKLRKRTPVSAERLEIRKLYEIMQVIQSAMSIDSNTITWLEERNLSITMARRLGIGVVRHHRKLLASLKKKYNEKLLSEIGLEDSRLFENRILFPLHDARGAVIAYAGRTTDAEWETKGLPKYINTRNSRIYNKKSFLYNARFLPADFNDRTYIVEGYMDAGRILASQYPACLAICQSNPSAEQMRFIASKLSRPVFALDKDRAGLDSMRKILESNPDARAILLPSSGKKKHDPDSYICQHGFEAFRKLEELDLLAFRILTDPFNQPASDVVDYLNEIVATNPMQHQFYINKLAFANGKYPLTRIMDGYYHIRNQSQLAILEELKACGKASRVTINVTVEDLSKEEDKDAKKAKAEV